MPAAIIEISKSLQKPVSATAVAHRLPLYTLNAADLRGLEAVLEVVDCK